MNPICYTIYPENLSESCNYHVSVEEIKNNQNLRLLLSLYQAHPHEPKALRDLENQIFDCAKAWYQFDGKPVLKPELRVGSKIEEYSVKAEKEKIREEKMD